MSRADTKAAATATSKPASTHDVKKLFSTLQDIDAISHEYAEQIMALVRAAHELVRCDATSLLALDGLLDLIHDRADLWCTSIESDAEELGAHEKGNSHIRLMLRLHDEERALKKGGAA